MQSGVFVELRMFRQNQVQLRDFVRKMDSDSILRKSGIFLPNLADFATSTFVASAVYLI